MRKRLATAIVAVAAIGLVTAGPATARPIEIGHIPKCTELVPSAISLPSRTSVRLQTTVLLDGVSKTRGKRVLRAAQRAYGRERIRLVPSYRSVSFNGRDAQRLIRQSKSFFGWRRPAGADVVYTLTSKDITASGNRAVAGMADCIGGVAFPRRAFAVGENFRRDGSFLGRKLTAKVAAHEVGHLMGGHHHYANCVEGLLFEIGREASPCTLMFNDVGLASLGFSRLNALVVKGHGEAYAKR